MTDCCPHCGETNPSAARFCEACGETLTAPTSAATVCAECGAEPTAMADGYCLVCGHKQPSPRDHIKLDLGHVAGVTDRGQRHHHNEDAMAFARVDGGVAIVVCDGVSTTENSDAASDAAARAALAALESTVQEPARAMVEATRAARRAVSEVPPGKGGLGNPSCTLVAAVVRGGEVTVGWLGDSRAYWLGAEPLLLTSDHSWAAEMVAAGAMTEEQAAASPRGSSITRWVGIDAPDVEPSVATFRFGAGKLLVCSDGLWNYAPGANQLAALGALDQPTLLAQADALVEFANSSGGHDNITAVLAQVDPDGPGSVGMVESE